MDADLILTNGRIYTVDARRSRHEAVAVKDGRIAALGSAAEAAEWSGPRTRTVDLGGRLVLPGFADAHLHPSFATGELFEVRLADCRSVEECLDRVARFAAEHPELPAIRGGGWYPTMVPMEGMTAEALDRAVPDRPACIHDDNVHAQWVNSELLRRAGVGREDPGWAAPSSSAAGRRAEGAAPRGLPVGRPRAARSTPSSERRQALRHFQRELAARYGIDAASTRPAAPGETMLDAYLSARGRRRADGEVRLDAMLDPDLPLDEQLEAAAEVRARFTGPLVRAAGVKLFVDGVIETHTATSPPASAARIQAGPAPSSSAFRTARRRGCSTRRSPGSTGRSRSTPSSRGARRCGTSSGSSRRATARRSCTRPACTRGRPCSTRTCGSRMRTS